MSQRNPLNERYNSENRTGKTRKSAASAKPKAERAATLRDPVKKTPKEKKNGMSWKNQSLPNWQMMSRSASSAMMLKSSS